MVGILVRGIPVESRKHIYVNLRAGSRYADIHDKLKLLEYERSTQAWTNVLAGLNRDKPTTATRDDYPPPMEIDMVWKGGKGKGKYKDEKPNDQKEEKVMEDTHRSCSRNPGGYIRAVGEPTAVRPASVFPHNVDQTACNN